MPENVFLESTVLPQFRGWAADSRLAVLALHTTDFKGQVIECAVIDRGGQVLFQSRFSTSEPVSDGAYAVHGIDAPALAGAPSLAEKWPELREVLAGYHVVCYSNDYAVKALRRSLPVISDSDAALLDILALGSNSVIDAYSFIAGKPSQSMKPGFSFVSLGDAYAATHDPGKLGRSSLANATKCLRVIESAAQMTEAQLMHLLPAPTLGPSEAQQDPAPDSDPQTFPQPRYSASHEALTALLRAGLLVRDGGLAGLPDRSFSMQPFTWASRHGIDVGLDRLCQVACEVWIAQHAGRYGMSQAIYWESTGARYSATLYGSENGPELTIDRQPAPGLALVNLLAAAGLGGVQ